MQLTLSSLKSHYCDNCACVSTWPNVVKTMASIDWTDHLSAVVLLFSFIVKILVAILMEKGENVIHLTWTLWNNHSLIVGYCTCGSGCLLRLFLSRKEVSFFWHIELKKVISMLQILVNPQLALNWFLHFDIKLAQWGRAYVCLSLSLSLSLSLAVLPHMNVLIS